MPPVNRPAPRRPRSPAAGGVAKPAAGGRRQAQAEATRAAIVEAARALFMREGYLRASIELIAREAGVAVQTVYNSVGNKPALLSAVLDRAAGGPEAPRPVAQFMQERADQIGNAGGIVAMLADWFAEVQPRTAPVFRLISEAAVMDPEAAALETARAQERLRNYGRAAQALKARGGLPPRMGLEDAAAIIWSIGHPRVYRTLVEEQGWSLKRYRDWVALALRSALLTS